MGKPRKLGMKTIYQRGREFAERSEQISHERRERRELAELERMKKEVQT